ncbi:MAG: nucleotidyltransferase family protein [Actinomycetota bacterium]|nr:nucleotidyltransferase family protein [Actinomycetota bacterium]
MTDTGVILAAGRGSRMGVLSEQYPKALLPIANRPLVEHQLDALAAVGIRNVYVVVRGGADRFERALASRPGLQLTYVEQPAALGSAHALGQLAPLVDRPFVLMLGDYFVGRLDLARPLERAASLGSSLILAKREADRRALAEACALDVDGEGHVRFVIEKPKAPRTTIKGCGVYVLAPDFFDAVRRTPRTMLRDEYELTVALDIYVRDGGRLYAEEFSSWDVNVTRPVDLLQANLLWLADRSRTELVGENVRLAAGSRLDKAVLGDGAAILEPSLLKEVVVFAGVELERPEVERALVTPGGVVQCA